MSCDLLQYMDSMRFFLKTVNMLLSGGQYTELHDLLAVGQNQFCVVVHVFVYVFFTCIDFAFLMELSFFDLQE